MIFEEAQKEFAVRYYRWAREEARREVEHGYPLMKRINTVTCRKHLRRMAQLSAQEQQAFAALLVKRCHLPQAVEASGDTPVSREELAEIDGYFSSFALELDPVDQAFLQRQLHGDPTTKLDRRRFRKIIKECLTPIFGKADSGGGGGTWSYTTPIENLRVITHIDTGGRYDLTYFHRIIYSGYLRLIETTSVLRWLGLMGQTMWQGLEDSRVEETAQLLAEVCDHFMKAAPKLLEGLSP